MDKPFLGGIVVALAVVVAGSAFFMAPRMQSPQAKVAVAAGEDTERARRLLNQFSDNEERIALLLDALAQAGIKSELQPQDVQRLLEEEEGRTAVEDQDKVLKEMLRAGAGQSSDLEARYLQAAYGSKWQEHQEPGPTGLGNNVNQMSAALQAGLKQRDRLINANQQLLEQALESVEAALARNVGDASGDGEVEPNRLHGVILYHLGEAGRREADVLRRRAASALQRLIDIGVEAKGWDEEKGVAGAAQLETRIQEANQRQRAAEAALTEIKSSATNLETRIDAMKSRIAALRADADAARGEMERMEEQGARLDHAGGFAEFARQFNDLAERYRQALSEIHRLETGSLRNARIDTSGDLLAGAYVPANQGEPVSADSGLPGLENEYAVLQLQVTAAEAALTAAQDEVGRLSVMQATHAERAAASEARLAQLATHAGAVYADFEKAAAEAESIEEQAAKRYAKSVTAFNAAARIAQDRAGAAESSVSTLSEAAKERKPSAVIAADTWFEQQFKLNAADAQIRLGALRYRIWSEDERIAKALTDLPPSLGLKELSPDAWREKATAAKTEGVDVLHKAYDAIANARGSLRGHWTLAAEAAAAANLLALFGEDAMKDIAIAAYEGVIADQADKPFVQAYVERLKTLKRP